MTTELMVPAFFNADRCGEVFRVPYLERAEQAKAWAQQHGIAKAAGDKRRVCLLAIDVQNTFCIPGFELFVGGHSGTGAVDDSSRLCEFIYRNLGSITEIAPTLDTHTAVQIFHPAFWVDGEGNNPATMTMIGLDEVVQGKWRVNPAIAASIASNLGSDVEGLQEFALHYAQRLRLLSSFGDPRKVATKPATLVKILHAKWRFQPQSSEKRGSPQPTSPKEDKSRG